MVFLFLRCGWSVNESSLQLGEDIRSYGFGGTGKSSRNSQFSNYGSKYGVGDVIGCYLVNPLKTFIFWQRNNVVLFVLLQDLSVEPYLISYTLNGRDLGVAFRVPSSELDGRALYPHILTKNQNFMVNFGQMPAPLQTLLPNFMPIGQVDLSEGLIRGSQAPAERGDCEVRSINIDIFVS